MSRVTINVNGLSLAHQDSGGVSTATLPDVCLTPGAGAVPYPNVAFSRDLASGTTLVRADGGNRIAVAGSSFARSTGGEPGTGGGVTSGVSGREATFLTHSFDITIEGRGACRLTDKLLHNRGNTIDCAGHLQATVGQSRGDVQNLSDRRTTGGKKRAPASTSPSPTTPRRVLGVDTNGDKLRPQYALGKRHRHFVGRYLIAFPADPAPNASCDFTTQATKVLNTSNGVNFGLTPTEVATLKAPVVNKKGASLGSMSVFAIWEVTKYRAIESGTPEGQFQLGAQDALVAQQQVAWCGGKGKPVYFTVDFDVTAKTWNEEVLDWLPAEGQGYCPNIMAIYNATGASALTGNLLMHYFEGILSVMNDPSHVGVYGSYYTVKKLFDHGKLIRYGWQQTFAKHFAESQVKKDDEKGIKVKAKLQARADSKIDPRAQLQQYNIKNYLQKDHGVDHWGVSGAGALDYDIAVADDFGQW